MHHPTDRIVHTMNFAWSTGSKKGVGVQMKPRQVFCLLLYSGVTESLFWGTKGGPQLHLGDQEDGIAMKGAQ